MKRKIAQHKYKNDKSISVGICDNVNEVDLLFLEIADKKDITTHYFRPDEVILIIKLLSELILKRVVKYDVNLGKKSKRDY